jgi:hypothetical protein
MYNDTSIYRDIVVRSTVRSRGFCPRATETRTLSSRMDAVAQLTAALSGRYEIERQIGAGGMATVYLGRIP